MDSQEIEREEILLDSVFLNPVIGGEKKTEKPLLVRRIHI